MVPVLDKGDELYITENTINDDFLELYASEKNKRPKLCTSSDLIEVETDQEEEVAEPEENDAELLLAQVNDSSFPEFIFSLYPKGLDSVENASHDSFDINKEIAEEESHLQESPKSSGLSCSPVGHESNDNSTAADSSADTKNPKPTTVKRKGKAKRGKKWLKIEEIILIGCVYDQLFKRGGLCTKTWSDIKKNYDLSCQKYFEAFGHCRPSVEARSKCALLRHFKVMKQRLKNDKNRASLFRLYYLKWEKIVQNLA